MAEGLVTYDEFKRLDLVIGTVTAVEPHPKADKRYVLKVSIGAEERQLVAGLKPYYPREKLLGKRVIVVANLAPALLRGVESNGMLLAAQHENRVIILTTDEDMPPGSKVL